MGKYQNTMTQQSYTPYPTYAHDTAYQQLYKAKATQCSSQLNVLLNFISFARQS